MLITSLLPVAVAVGPLSAAVVAVVVSSAGALLFPQGLTPLLLVPVVRVGVSIIKGLMALAHRPSR
jgi:hypothetical protein